MAFGYPETNMATRLDELAASNPDGVFLRVVGRDNDFQSLRDITWSQLARAVHRASRWLDETLGPSRRFDPFVLYTEPDALYPILIIAAIRTQRVALLVDGLQGTQDGFVNTLKEFSCTTWVADAATAHIAETLQADKGLNIKIVTCPPMEHWLEDVDFTPYPYSKTWDEAVWDPLFVLQTSGSTGIPKSFIYRHAMNATFNNYGTNDLLHTPMTGTILWGPRPWWLGGIAGLLHWPLYHETSSVVAPYTPFPTTAEWTIRALEAVPVDGMFINPSLVRDICLSERGIELLRRCRFVAYGGSALDGWVGDLLAAHTQLIPFIGSTEMGVLNMRRWDEPHEWRYYVFHPTAGTRMDAHGDGLFELVVERRPELKASQGIFCTMPHLKEYRSSDLYSKHPTKPGYFLYEGRADDTFRLKWFTRVKATETESELERDPFVKRAIMGGEGREEPWLIVQVAAAELDDSETEERLMDRAWDVVSDVNGRVKAEAQVSRKHVILTRPEKPLQLTTKGSLNRPAISTAYKAEIEALYR
jgi:acyl-coenzyme A synthetase/AMP-(fatty) acid ligase